MDIELQPAGRAKEQNRAQPLVSVVTPLYNGGPYLAACIESVLAQSYRNWEYVIANNCSTDDSLALALSYARQDARIRVLDNDTFLNQKQNWNHALQQMAPGSKYCKVLHSDDWLFPECLARMVALAEAHPSVGLVGAYRLDEERVDLDGLPYPSHVLPGREVCRRNLLDKVYVFGSPSSLLIRSDLIRARERFYDEHSIHADTEICFELLQHCDFGFVHQILTYTRRHNESMSSWAQRFNTRFLGNFVAFLKYGPVYLTREEYAGRLRGEMQGYYSFLARSAFELKGADFWRFHRDQLRDLGYPMRWGRLGWAMLRELSNFRDTVKRLRAALASRRGERAAPKAPDWSAALRSIYTSEGEATGKTGRVRGRRQEAGSKR